MTINQTQSLFNAALTKIVLPSEGGYSNHRNDRGGPTNFGITWRTAARHGISDVKSLTRTDVEKIYYKDYWVPSGCSTIKDPGLAIAHFDTAINMGLGGAKKVLINALNKCGAGVSGSMSMKDLLAAANQIDPHKLQQAYLSARIDRYNSIIENNPSQSVFRRGWMRRMKDLAKVIGSDLSSFPKEDISSFNNAIPKFFKSIIGNVSNLSIDLGVLFSLKLNNGISTVADSSSKKDDLKAENLKRENEEYYVNVYDDTKKGSGFQIQLNKKDQQVNKQNMPLQIDAERKNLGKLSAKSVTEQEILDELSRERQKKSLKK